MPLRLLAVLRLEKRSDVEHGRRDVLTEAARLLQGTQRDPEGGLEGFYAGRLVSLVVVLVVYLSYSAGTGVFAGDVECDEVFPTDNIRHTVTIIGHLGRTRKLVRLTNPDDALRKKRIQQLHSLGRSRLRRLHIWGTC